MDLLRGPTVQRHRHQLGRDRKCQETQPGSGEGVWDWQDGEKSVTAVDLSGDTDNDMNCLLMDNCYSYAWVALIVKSCVRCKTWWWLLMNVGWRETELTPVMLSMIVWSHDNVTLILPTYLYLLVQKKLTCWCWSASSWWGLQCLPPPQGSPLTLSTLWILRLILGWGKFILWTLIFTLLFLFLHCPMLFKSLDFCPKRSQI